MRLRIIALSLALFAFAASTAMGAPLPRRAAKTAEPLDGIETVFGELAVPQGYRLRTILTRPKGTVGKLPAVYFVQWLSCDSVEISANDGWAQMLRALVRETGMVVMRLDKAGVGDSEGGPCAVLDYDTELQHHRLALASLFDNPWVDPQRVLVFGASMGANYAPLVVEDRKVKAVAVWGGGAQSWFERQLGFERRALELGGKSGEDIDTRMRLLSRFYGAYLLDGRSPADIKRSDPNLGAAWGMVTGTEGDTQFGRPLAFHRQAQRHQWAAAWSRVDAPVLALFGQYDWYESIDGVHLIARIVNGRKPGSAEVRIAPGIDHHFMRYRSPEGAFAGKGGTPQAAAATAILIPWLKQHAK